MIKKRMPQLTIDEVLLLIDTYFQLQNVNESSLRTELISELSESMRRLPFFPQYKNDPAFRSVSGMNMCLSNVAYVDPDKNSKFGHGSNLQRRVFEFYTGRRVLLHHLANAIKSICEYDFPLLTQYKESITGQLLPSYHAFLEQTEKHVINAKRLILSHKRFSCAICNTDLEEKYGDYGQQLLEAHLVLPLDELNNVREITSSEIIFVCPTCHKLSHLELCALSEKKTR